MRTSRHNCILASLAGIATVLMASVSAEEPVAPVRSPTVAAIETPTVALTSTIATSAGPVIAPGESGESADPCASQGGHREVVASPTRPTWDYPALTTQCGIVETDYGWLDQPMGASVSQRILISSVRYGLTPRLDLRWGLTNHISQSGGDSRTLEGVGDQWLSVRYRFHEQGRAMPAFAFLYGAKIPVANPGKGFGSGFVDHQLLFIASRDLGKYHLDFNIDGTVVGKQHGHDGAAQFGLALTQPLTKKLSAILENYGGPQPGISDRFGAVLMGASCTLHPQLVIDGGYTRAYTAGSPRQQVLVGITYAKRSGIAPLPRGSATVRLLGR
jgi:hypothetical protein